MDESTVFDLVCDELEKSSSLDRLQARGTVRLALKEAGLESHSVTLEQMAAVLEKVMPGELAARGLPAVEALCASIAAQLGGISSSPVDETPEAIFARLAGR